MINHYQFKVTPCVHHQKFQIFIWKLTFWAFCAHFFSSKSFKIILYSSVIVSSPGCRLRVNWKIKEIYSLEGGPKLRQSWTRTGGWETSSLIFTRCLKVKMNTFVLNSWSLVCILSFSDMNSKEIWNAQFSWFPPKRLCSVFSFPNVYSDAL